MYVSEFWVVTMAAEGTPDNWSYKYTKILDGFDDRAAALEAGFDKLGTNDFYIATTVDGQLTAFGWGVDDFGPDAREPLTTIAGQLGLAAVDVTLISVAAPVGQPLEAVRCHETLICSKCMIKVRLEGVDVSQATNLFNAIRANHICPLPSLLDAAVVQIRGEIWVYNDRFQPWWYSIGYEPMSAGNLVRHAGDDLIIALVPDPTGIIPAAMAWRDLITSSPNMWADEHNLALIAAVDKACGVTVR